MVVGIHVPTLKGAVASSSRALLVLCRPWQQGIVPRACQEVLEAVAARSGVLSSSVRIAYVEVFNNEVRPFSHLTTA
jgi:hypothetical protein